jgi:baseplate J-like protein
MVLIPAPDLDLRNEEQLAAEAIARVSGALTVDRVVSQIAVLRAAITILQSGNAPAPICPELTNANPSSPHTVLLEVQGWLLGQQARRINQLPVRDEIEFHRLFGIEERDATPATTSLQFTVANVPLNTAVTVPGGTVVSTTDKAYSFATDIDLVIPYGNANGTVTATRTVAGATLLSPDVLTVMTDVIAFVSAVTNPSAVDSGTEAETVDAALQRARNYQRRGERLVSARDLEDAILEDIMLGAGIVKAFPFVKAGDFSSLNHLKAGYTTVVVMTPTGAVVTDAVKAQITEMLEQAIGAQFIYIIDPQFRTFSVEANLKLEGLTPQSAILAAVERSLRDFYAAKTGNFGRKILRAEIIAVIEGTTGVDRIASDNNGPIVQSPGADVDLAPYELPKLVNVTLHVVN